MSLKNECSEVQEKIGKKFRALSTDAMYLRQFKQDPRFEFLFRHYNKDDEGHPIEVLWKKMTHGETLTEEEQRHVIAIVQLSAKISRIINEVVNFTEAVDKEVVESLRRIDEGVREAIAWRQIEYTKRARKVEDWEKRIDHLDRCPPHDRHLTSEVIINFPYATPPSFEHVVEQLQSDYERHGIDFKDMGDALHQWFKEFSNKAQYMFSIFDHIEGRQQRLKARQNALAKRITNLNLRLGKHIRAIEVLAPLKDSLERLINDSQVEISAIQEEMKHPEMRH